MGNKKILENLKVKVFLHNPNLKIKKEKKKTKNFAKRTKFGNIENIEVLADHLIEIEDIEGILKKEEEGVILQKTLDRNIDLVIDVIDTKRLDPEIENPILEIENNNIHLADLDQNLYLAKMKYRFIEIDRKRKNLRFI